jgi:hypothetical protein
MRPCAGAALLACAAAFAAVPSAAAQGPAQVVGPTPSGASLVVFDRDGELCGRVQGSELWDHHAQCGRPSGALRAPFLSSIGTGLGGSVRVWGVVAPEVARVEVVMEGGVHFATATEAGEAYRGRFAGVGRFFLLDTRRHGRAPLRDAGYLRLLDPQGGLLAIVDIGFDVRAGPDVRLASGRFGAVRWRLSAAARRVLAPLPGHEERFGRGLCIDLKSRGPTLGRNGIGTCQEAGYPGYDYLPGAGQDCGGLGTSLVGALPVGTRVVAVLGSGRRQRLPTYPLPARLGDRVVFGRPLGTRTAIRRLEYAGPGGLRRTVTLGLAPAQVNCRGFGGSGLLIGYDAAFGTTHGRPGLRVKDRGVLLCTSLAGSKLVAADCALPPVTADGARVFSLPEASSTYFAAVLPADVATTEVELDGGPWLSLPATVAGPYTGRYAGAIRFVETQLIGRHAITGVRLLDAQGRLIEKRPGPDPAPFARQPVALLRASTGARLVAGIVARSALGPRHLCLALARRLPDTSRDCGYWWGGSIDVSVGCRPRSMVFWGTVGASARSVEIRTDRATVHARMVDLPRAFESKRRAVLAVVPSTATPRKLVVERSGGDKRVRLPMRSAARQCGYTGVVASPSPF